MKDISLKTKMALAVSMVFVLAIVMTSWCAVTYLEKSFKNTIAKQQFVLVSSLAQNIDDKLGIAQGALIADSRDIPPTSIGDADDAQHFLDGRSALHSIFDNGLFLFSTDGHLISESPYLSGRRGRDCSFRDYFRQTVATGKPYISKPFISTHNPGHPVILLTVPLFDSSGRLRGVFAGGFDLWGKNFLQNLSQAKIGKSGYFFLTDRDRTIIINHLKSRIMTRALPAGANRVYDEALGGSDGSGENTDASKERFVTSAVNLRTSDWLLVGNFPLHEAYAPLALTKRYILLASGTFMILVLAVTWLLMWHLTRPLMTITRHVESLPGLFGMQPLVAIDTGDEIGTLAKSFNRMVHALEAQQAALRESEEKFCRAFRATPTLLAITTLAEGRIIEVNGAFERICGFRREEGLGRTVTELGVWADPEERGKVIDILKKGGVVRDMEVNLRTRSGEGIVGLYAAELIDLQGEPHLLSIVTDITARKRAAAEVIVLNTQLTARAAELEAANRELEAFNYTVSHDLRSPLAGIIGFCLLIKDTCADRLDSRTRDYLERILGEAENMDHLISALLNFSHLTRCALHRETVDLSTVARTVAAELMLGDMERDVRFSISDGVFANGDERLLRVVVENLIGNAWKYTGKVEKALIEFGASEANGQTVFFVRDNGVGFDMGRKERLFIPFQRLHADSDFAGHGIGLATVQRIVHRHQGKIWAESSPERGATFCFTV